MASASGFDFPNKNYIYAAKNPSVVRQDIIREYIAGINAYNFNAHISKYISLSLGLTGKPGSFVAFGKLPENLEDTTLEGRFVSTESRIDKIELRSNYFPPNEFSPMAYEVLFHESIHKADKDVAKEAKYFGKNVTPSTESVLFSDRPKTEELMGLGNGKTLYFLNRGEQRAFLGGYKFGAELLQESLSIAKASGNTEAVARIERDIKLVEAKSAVSKNRLSLAEANYNANRHKFYHKATSSFDAYAKIAEAGQNGLYYSSDMYTDRLHKVFGSDKFDQQNAIKAMVQIVGVCPERSRVETLVDTIIKDNTGNYGPHVEYLFSNGIPLTKSDVTRLILCADNFSRDSKSKIYTGTFGKIDEEFLANTLIQSLGVATAKGAVNTLRTSNNAENIDFDVIENILAQHKDQPLLVHNGVAIPGAAHLLDYVAKRCTPSGNTREFLQNKADISKNLVNIMNHFGTLDPNNPQCVKALTRFISSPHMQQFKDKLEPFSEVGNILAPHIARDIASVIREESAIRFETEQEEEFVPPEPNPEAVEAELKATKELQEAIEALAKSMKELAEIVGKVDAEKFVEGLGIDIEAIRAEQNNGEHNPDEENPDEENPDEENPNPDEDPDEEFSENYDLGEQPILTGENNLSEVHVGGQTQKEVQVEPETQVEAVVKNAQPEVKPAEEVGFDGGAGMDAGGMEMN